MKFSAGYLIGAGTVVGLAVAFLSGVGAAAYVLAETERKKNELADAAAEKVKSTSIAETLGGFLFGNKN